MKVQTRLTLVSLFLAATVFCACVTLSSSGKSSQRDLDHLMNLLGKLKGAQRVRQQTSGGDSLSQPEAAMGSLADDDVSDFASTGEGAGSAVEKRQGAWSFDYGLGGGRFGKRGYGYSDYGLGGGRYGRDVDHVDPNPDVEEDASL